MYKQTFSIGTINGESFEFNIITDEIKISREDVLAHFHENVAQDVKDSEIIELFRVVKTFEPVDS